MNSNALSTRAAALVIVLAFVVLLTGLVMAFFSQSILDRQISNSSASQVKVEALASGAIDTLISDLKQEIAAGSTQFSTTGGNIYYPKRTPIGTSSTMTPFLSGADGSAGKENLVKRSAGGTAFYSGPDYDTANYPAPNRATAVPTTRVSANGRSINSARWNKTLLLKKNDPASTSDFTPVDTVNVTPDWIIVTKEGKNPTVWNQNLISRPRSDTAAVGRFAYLIYDEGGVLDLNVAGYPSVLSPDSAGTKDAMGLADLRQLMRTAELAPLSSTQQNGIVDAIVGWRQYASLQPSGSFPLYSLTPAAAGRFVHFLRQDPSGFLRTNNSSLFNKESDRRFMSRQQLLQFFDSLAKSGVAPAENLQHLLQYLGTFSRGLDQPSFVKVQSIDASKPGYDGTAPKLLPPRAGGNNAGGDTSTGFAWSQPLDLVINPPFLNVRLGSTTPGGRSDHGDLKVGEPLVKKRFALNRLAWITFNGPSADNLTNMPVQETIKALGGDPADSNHPVYRFVAQGTAANIQTFFGLTWVPSAGSEAGFWRYNVHNRAGTMGPIRKLEDPADTADVVRANREADFFELLKASVNAGSIAKPGTDLPSVANAAGRYRPVGEQYFRDTDVDGAIIQMAANIVDQFDSDGYVTRIKFNNGAGEIEYRGVENLPYLSRILNGTIRAVAPGASVWPYNNGGTAGSGTVSNTGLGVMLQTPELWNPHDWSGADTTALNRTLGMAGPTRFRIYASGDPLVISTLPDCLPGNDLASPGYRTLYGFDWAGEQITPSVQNTEIRFEIPRDACGAQLFREPTFLFRPGKPSGSNLSSPPFQNPSRLGRIGNTSTLFVDGGIKGAVGGIVHPRVNPPVSYVGIYLGTFPLIWRTSATSSVFRADHFKLRSPAIMTYHLQYEDEAGNWVTYDQKSVQWGDQSIVSGSAGRPMREINKGFLSPRWEWDRYATVLDPRTSRFNFISTASFSAQHYTYPPFNDTIHPDRGWTPSLSGNGNAATKAEGITVTMRNGKNLGVAIMADLYFHNTVGFYPGSWASNNGARALRPGLFSQNVNVGTAGNQPLGDGEGYPNTGPAGQMNSPQCYADADGVVRRAMGGYVSYPYTSGGTSNPNELLGLPLRTAHSYSESIDPATGQPEGLKKIVENGYTLTNSRPLILNRPFRTVAELAYTFSGTPWKNLNFSMPESGDSALLDVFSINTTDNPDALVAGKVNLNTRQASVLQAIISGAYRDEWNAGTVVAGGPGALAEILAHKLVERTSDITTPGKGPLQNTSDLVGRWKTGSRMTIPASGTKTAYDGLAAYEGFSSDLNTALTAALPDSNIDRFRNATLRALMASGQTRIWNLMIDVVAQTGRYPVTAASLDQFVVESERRYWVHLAIDRLTGDVVDRQVEIVNE